MSDLDPRYVIARRVLLDALTALEQHADVLILAGAQAIYLHTGEGDLAIAPFTTDADLAIDPRQLAPEPELERAMLSAGFRLAEPDGHIEPGIWFAERWIDGEPISVPVDLIVPAAVAAPGGRRGARLGAHGRRAARKTVGLEAVLVDYAPMTPDDDRFP